MAKTRDFGSLEQALLHALKDLTDEDLAATKKKKEDWPLMSKKSVARKLATKICDALEL